MLTKSAKPQQAQITPCAAVHKVPFVGTKTLASLKHELCTKLRLDPDLHVLEHVDDADMQQTLEQWRTGPLHVPLRLVARTQPPPTTLRVLVEGSSTKQVVSTAYEDDRALKDVLAMACQRIGAKTYDYVLKFDGLDAVCTGSTTLKQLGGMKSLRLVKKAKAKTSTAAKHAPAAPGITFSTTPGCERVPETCTANALVKYLLDSKPLGLSTHKEATGTTHIGSLLTRMHTPTNRCGPDARVCVCVPVLYEAQRLGAHIDFDVCLHSTPQTRTSFRRLRYPHTLDMENRYNNQTKEFRFSSDRFAIQTAFVPLLLHLVRFATTTTTNNKATQTGRC